jgi:hypothetical protein
MFREKKPSRVLSEGADHSLLHVAARRIIPAMLPREGDV